MKTLLPRPFLIAHPLLTGWLWAGLTVPLTMIVMSVVGLKQFHVDQWPHVLALLAVGAPVFGYTGRAVCLREDRDAR